MAVDSESLDFTFLDAVNRVLRSATLIRGDDDDVTTFSDTQHSANLNLARIAIQDELTELTSDSMLDLEFFAATLSTTNGVRVYDLPADFIRFEGDAFFYKSSSNFILTEYPGGRRALKRSIYDYKSQTGDPHWWYWEPSAKKRIGFYQVPNGMYTYDFDYQRSVYVTAEIDELPFHNQEEADTFCQMAGRRFKYLFERAENLQTVLGNDAMYQNAKSRLYNLMRPTPSRQAYGRVFI